MKKQNQQTTSEAIRATQNKQNKTDADLLRSIADKIESGTLDNFTDEYVNEVASVMFDVLRSSAFNCYASIITPQEVIDEAEQAPSDEDEPVILTSDEARKVCRCMMNNETIGSLQSQVFVEYINDALEKRKRGGNLKWGTM